MLKRIVISIENDGNERDLNFETNDKYTLLIICRILLENTTVYSVSINEKKTIQKFPSLNDIEKLINLNL